MAKVCEHEILTLAQSVLETNKQIAHKLLKYCNSFIFPYEISNDIVDLQFNIKHAFEPEL